MKIRKRISIPLLVVLAIAAPTMASSLLDRANRLFVHERYREAAAVYLQVAETGGEEAPEAAYFVGKAFEKAGEDDRAVPAYDRVIRSFPDSQWAYKAGNALGDLYVSQGQWEEALRSYEWVAGRIPDSTPGVLANLNRANLLVNAFNTGNRDYVQAIEVYNDILENDAVVVEELKPQVFFGIGEAYRNLGRHEESILNYRTAVELDRGGVWGAAAQNMIGRVLMEKNKLAEAQQVFQETQQNFPRQQAMVQIAQENYQQMYRQRSARVVANIASPGIPAATPSSILKLVDGVRVESEDWQVTADRGRWDPGERILHCEGNVRLMKGGRLLFSAEQLSFRPPMDQTLDLEMPEANIRQRLQGPNE